MNNRIKVLSDISECINNLSQLLSSLETFEEKSGGLLSQLNDTGKWSGESQEKCVQILQLIQEYETELRPICEQYRQDIMLLTSDADSFKGKSRFVSNIEM